MHRGRNKNNEDHSSERTDKCAQKRFDKVGIVRDVRLDDYPGVSSINDFPACATKFFASVISPIHVLRFSERASFYC
jgi:hypothetical protein